MTASNRAADRHSVEPKTLYVCATPIGNLEDITLRALRILKSVDFIVAEDTRHTRKLLAAYEIQTPLMSLHEHNEAARTPHVIKLLTEGNSIALVSDAGMPGISDPGSLLIRACIEANVSVVPIPGPTAFVAALVPSGLPTDRFVFEGFLPRDAKKRRARLEALATYPETLIFYEAPHRLRSVLRDMLNVWPERSAVLAREMTKKYEEFIRGSLSELLAWCEHGELRGEFVVLVEGAQPTDDAKKKVTEADITDRLSSLLRYEGYSVRDAVRAVVDELNVPRRTAYDLALRLTKDD